MHMKDFVSLLNQLDITPCSLIEDNNRSTIDYGITANDLFLEENRMLRQQLFRLCRSLKVKEP